MKKIIITILSALLIVCSLGFTACSSEHTHVFDKEVATAEYLKSEATCTKKATYYKSCECGEKGTAVFRVGEKLAHVFENQKVAKKHLKSEATCTAKAVYYVSCDCGENGEDTFEYGEINPHSYTEQVESEEFLVTKGDCKTKSVYYKSCVCGLVGTATFEAKSLDNHNFGDDYICSGCGEKHPVVAEREIPAHKSTVIFFDTEVGKTQLTTAGGLNINSSKINLDTSVKVGNEPASTRIDIDLADSSKAMVSFSYNIYGYQFEKGDYVTFNMYLEVDKVPAGKDINAQYVNLRLGTGTEVYATRVLNNSWATVLVPAEVFANGTNGMIIEASSNFVGAIYFTRVKALPETQVMPIYNATTADSYTIGSTEFVTITDGKYQAKYGGETILKNTTSYAGVSVGTCIWSPNGALFNQESDYIPYYVNGAVRYYIRTDHFAADGQTRHNPTLALQLKEEFVFSTPTCTTIRITMRGAVPTSVYLRHTADNTLKGERTLKLVETLDNGFSVYEISTDFTAGWAGERFDLMYFRTSTENDLVSYYQVEIADIEFTGHNYNNKVVSDKTYAAPATCVSGATYYYTCACGKNISTTKTFEVGEPHNYDQMVTYSIYLAEEATCAVAQKYYYTCVCGAVGTETFVDPNGTGTGLHIYDQEVVHDDYIAIEAECGAQAQYYFTCVCGEIGEETFGYGDAHKYEQIIEDKYIVSEATCQAKAVYSYACVCGLTNDKTYEYGEKAAHVLDDNFKCECGYLGYAEARTGADANTVFFFDKALLGPSQLTSSANTNISGVATFDETKGATKITISTAGSSSSDPRATIGYMLKGYEFAEGDYVAFDIYLDLQEGTSTSAVFRLKGSAPAYGALVYDKAYAQVLVPASQFADNGTFYIYTKANADIYLFNAKALSANEVKDIATTGSETTYKLGAYDFVGGNYATTAGTLGTPSFEATYKAIQGASVGACAWSTNGAVYSQASDVVPYYVNGAIRFYVRDHQKNGMDSTQKVVLKTAKGYNFSSGVISVVARGVTVTNVTLKGSTNASYGGSRAMSKDADQSGVPAGYVRYTMDAGFNNTWASETLDYFIFTVQLPTGVSFAQGSIIDISLPA